MQQNTFTQSFVQMLNIDEQRKDMFKQFLVDFFKFQIDAELDVINLEIEFSEDDEDNDFDQFRSDLESLFDTVYDMLGINVCDTGLNYLEREEYPEEFCAWFNQFFVNNRDAIEFGNIVQSEIIPMYHDDFTNALENDDDHHDRINEMLEFLDSKND